MYVNMATFISNFINDWQQKWESDTPKWHKDHVHEMLQKHYDYLSGGMSSCSIYVPMCGKTLDMKWLAELGHNVVGCDVIEKSAELFYNENNISFEKYNDDGFIIYKSTDQNLKIKFYVGDVYKCVSDRIGTFDAIWDCNAFGAVDKEDRERYISLMSSLLKPSGRLLLCANEYDQALRWEAPHTIPSQLVKELFGHEGFSVELVGSTDISERFSVIFGIPKATLLCHRCTKTSVV
jgi:thiopurine S-methyltransferase